MKLTAAERRLLDALCRWGRRGITMVVTGAAMRTAESLSNKGLFAPVVVRTSSVESTVRQQVLDERRYRATDRGFEVAGWR